MSKTLVPRFPLQHERFLDCLTPEVQDQIARLSVSRAFAARQRIYGPGDPADCVFWVREGRIKVSHISDDGRELTFRHLRPGEMFGEDCMDSGDRRRNHAESMDESLLFCMPSFRFHELLSREISFTLAVSQHSCRRAREVESVFSDTVFRPVRERIAAGLLRLYHQGDPGEKTIRITHQEVANLVGSTRETTTSVLHTFREAGVLEIANRRVTVLDPDALRQFAQQS